MIDNLTALKEMYFQDEDPILPITREGISVGITCVLANSSTNSIGYRYLANFSSRIALFCNDSTEYSNVFESCRKRVKPIPGRALITLNKEIYTCQTYRAFSGEKEIDRVKEMRAFVEETNAMNPDSSAKPIPEIPELLTVTALLKDYAFLAKQTTGVIAGLDYATVDPVMLDCMSLGFLGMIGRKNTGRSNFVRYFVRELRRKNTVELRVVDDVNRRFASLKDDCAQYSIRTEDIAVTLREWDTELQKRYKMIEDGDFQNLAGEPFLLYVLQHDDAYKVISGDNALLAIYKQIISKYKALRVCIFFTNIPNENIQYSSPEVLKMMRDNRQILFFDDMNNMKAFEIPYAVQKMYRKPIEKGDGYLLLGNDVHKIKTPFIG